MIKVIAITLSIITITRTIITITRTIISMTITHTIMYTHVMLPNRILWR